jgi:hypothetical protein
LALPVAAWKWLMFAYNAIHTYAGPLLPGAYSLAEDHRKVLSIALVRKSL